MIPPLIVFSLSCLNIHAIILTQAWTSWQKLLHDLVMSCFAVFEAAEGSDEWLYKERSRTFEGSCQNREEECEERCSEENAIAGECILPSCYCTWKSPPPAYNKLLVWSLSKGSNNYIKSEGKINKVKDIYMYLMSTLLYLNFK